MPFLSEFFNLIFYSRREEENVPLPKYISEYGGEGEGWMGIVPRLKLSENIELFIKRKPNVKNFNA